MTPDSKPGPAPHLITFGCRLNSYESEVIREHAARARLQNVSVINTCAVTNEAVRQARQKIRRLRRDYPDRTIIVTGCAAQIGSAEFAAMPEVDHVLGNDEKLSYSAYAALAQKTAPDVQAGDIMALTQARHHEISGFAGRARAYVQVQNGCDHRCTFCIIPYGRGNSRSVPAEHIVAQIRRLVDEGHGEIVLTGVDMTAYGADLAPMLSLGQLTQRILRDVPDLLRLRLSSIDALESDDALLDVVGSEARVMPHLHLSLQAGDDMILKRMKRRHLRADAISYCEALRKARPDMVFGADLIAGFPTESEQMFAQTLALIDDCKLTYLHVFPYSPRQGTPAARMPQVERQVVKARAEKLRHAGRLALDRFLHRQVGQTVDVLRETEHRGHTPHFAPVKIGTPGASGQFCRVHIKDVQDGQLIGQEIL